MKGVVERANGSQATTIAVVFALFFTLLSVPLSPFAGVALASATSPSPVTPASSVNVIVDVTRRLGPIPMGHFSMNNYVQFHEQAEVMAQNALRWLNLRGAGVRLEVTPERAWPQPEEFLPQHLLRHTDDSLAAAAAVRSAALEPMLLITYNTPWLAAHGRPSDPPTSVDAWVEFALETLAALGGPDETETQHEPAVTIPYVEIWNEPNLSRFWSGTREEYFRLFRAVAAAIHQRYPGVMVGGPAVSPESDAREWIDAFIREVGDVADFVSYHTYAQSVEQMIADVRTYGEMFREATGKTGPRVMVTETDFVLPSRLKRSYLVERQLQLMDVADELLGLYHFQLPAYHEGSYLFGLIEADGSVIEHNYWPYWILRHLRGERVAVEMAPQTNDLLATASLDPDGHRVTLVVHLKETAREPVQVDMRLPAPGLALHTGAEPDAADGAVQRGVDEANVTALSVDSVDPAASADEFAARVDRIGPSGDGLVEWKLVSGSTEWFRSMVLQPGDTVSVTLVPLGSTGSAGSGGVDEPLWASIDVPLRSAVLGETLEVIVEAVNTGTQTASGSLFLVGAPTDWQLELVEGSSTFNELKPGESVVNRYRVTTTSATPADGSNIYAYVRYRVPGARSAHTHSIPVRVSVRAPVEFSVFPILAYVNPGGRLELEVEAQNTFETDVSGDLYVSAPDGWRSSRFSYHLGVGARATYVVTMDAPADASEGAVDAEVVFEYGGATFRAPVRVVVKSFETDQASVPIPLDRWFNADGLSFARNPGDLVNYGGPFSFPAEFAPRPGKVSFLGITFEFPSSADKTLNAVEARGQEIPVPQGSYRAIALLAQATNGDKRVPVTLLYADETTEEVLLELTDWCFEPKFGEIPVVRAPYRHIDIGVLRDCAPMISVVSLSVDADRDLRGIRLPEKENLYVYALTALPAPQTGGAGRARQ